MTSKIIELPKDVWVDVQQLAGTSFSKFQVSNQGSTFVRMYEGGQAPTTEKEGEILTTHQFNYATVVVTVNETIWVRSLGASGFLSLQDLGV